MVRRTFRCYPSFSNDTIFFNDSGTTRNAKLNENFIYFWLKYDIIEYLIIYLYVQAKCWVNSVEPLSCEDTMKVLNGENRNELPLLKLSYIFNSF